MNSSEARLASTRRIIAWIGVIVVASSGLVAVVRSAMEPSSTGDTIEDAIGGTILVAFLVLPFFFYRWTIRTWLGTWIVGLLLLALGLSWAIVIHGGEGQGGLAIGWALPGLFLIAVLGLAVESLILRRRGPRQSRQ